MNSSSIDFLFLSNDKLLNLEQTFILGYMLARRKKNNKKTKKNFIWPGSSERIIDPILLHALKKIRYRSTEIGKKKLFILIKDSIEMS